jgi:hypothetical protein
MHTPATATTVLGPKLADVWQDHSLAEFHLRTFATIKLPGLNKHFVRRDKYSLL